MPSRIQTVFFSGMKPEFWSLVSQSLEVMSACTLVRVLALIRCLLVVLSSLRDDSCKRDAFIWRTCGKSTSNTLLFVKEFSRDARVSMPVKYRVIERCKLYD